jgi:hypothetical protein
MNTRTRTTLLATLLFGLSTAYATDTFELPPILYSETTPTDRVANFQERLEQGDWSCDTQDPRVFLREVLRALEVPEESQVLVFSQTSQQISRISPYTPRAIYFSEDCYVGWVQGGPLEISTSDPRLGTTFYVLEPRRGKTPRLRRDGGCLSCHGGGKTGGVPGLLVRSVYADPSGRPIFSAGSFLTTDRSPFEERWGGWYVTGRHGKQRHMGNSIAERLGSDARLDRELGANRTSLAGLFSTAPYLRATSDIVALMVLEHQVAVHNAFVQASFATRRAQYRQGQLRRALGPTNRESEASPLRGKVSSPLRGTGQRIVERELEKVVEFLLFHQEAPLRDDVVGGAAFEESFLSRRRATADGHSLRDFDLRRRLFRYRLSYMIHSSGFEALPRELRDRIYQRLWDILHHNEPEKYHLGRREALRILQILRETKKKLPAYWYPENARKRARRL